VAVEDGWPNVIHACKEDGKSRRLDEDKRRDLKEKEAWLPDRRKAIFGGKSELAR
jgi:hypothetical protein